MGDQRIEFDEDFDSSPVVLKSGKITIYNLTLINLQHTNNEIAIFSFDSTDIELIKIQFEGKIQSTLFKGSVTGFTLRDA